MMTHHSGSLHPHFWILWVKVEISHQNQWDRLMPINQQAFKEQAGYFYPRTFIARHKFDLKHVLTVTMIIENFMFETFESCTNCQLWVWNIFVTSVDTSIEKLCNMHQSDQFDLIQGHSSNRHFLWNRLDTFSKDTK